MEFEFDYRCLARAGESVSGDSVVVRAEQGNLFAALSDGMGNGAAAGIRSELLTSMASQLWERGMGCEQAFAGAAEGIPYDPVRDMDCASLTALTVSAEGELRLCERGNPAVVCFRRNEPLTLPRAGRRGGGRGYDYASRTVRPGDTLLLFSDGLERAGVGGMMRLGMGREGLLDYLRRISVNRLCAARICFMLENLAVSLFEGSLSDDVSFACIRIR